MINFTIPLAPISKKNHQQIFINKKTNKPFVSPSSNTRNMSKMHYGLYLKADRLTIPAILNACSICLQKDFVI